MGAAGATALVLVFGRLAARTTRDGGPYVYVQEAFGDLTAFLMAWGYWIGFWGAIPVVAIGFVGYLGFFFPIVAQSVVAQALSALALIAVLTLINVRGLKEMSTVQIGMTLLKIVPLLAIIGAAALFGSAYNLPAFNPSNKPILPQLAAVTLITLWPFTGFEAAATSAGSIRNPERTIPRALAAAIVLVAVIYLSASFAVNLLVPPAQLAQSQAPFADAAHVLGPWGGFFVASGALLATAGTLNGIIFTSGQMPMAVAEDGKAPAWMAKLNRGGVPYWSVLLSSVLGAILLFLNYSRGLIGAYTFLLMMATALSLIYYFFCGLAEIKHSWRTSKIWTSVALFGCAYSVFALVGSGIEVSLWGGALMLLGLPLYFVLKPRKAAALNPAS
ncbi:MAG: amino acid permease [Proteobacteria bacterium]|nr:amino acid permease [Pseudomonadota bacterium]